eukprot:gb/GFBE01028488.1/.p1 GENE.gb/GFBE01028488.1/~~gb/GFBE01028488.1/.p1  ORF type:complete len:435 (+),score=70.62 gb/GFBE01028488.1/:1-1305(+)
MPDFDGLASCLEDAEADAMEPESSSSEIMPAIHEECSSLPCEEVVEDVSTDSPFRSAAEDLVKPWTCYDEAEVKPVDSTVLMDDGTREAEGWTSGADRQQEEPVLSLVSLNSKTAPGFDLVRGSMSMMLELPSSAAQSARTVRVSCGRDASNTIVLADSRVSSVHFSLRVRAARGGLVAIELTDQSSNGTWVNGQKVGKGRKVNLGVGDKILMLPASQVGSEAEAGYLLLHDVRGARCTATMLGASGRLEDTAAFTLTRGELQENPLLSRVLEPELRCHICTEALYECLTIVPCGHNFCAPCLLRWRRNSPNCPECRAPIQQGVRNLSVDKVVETFRQAHPEASRSESELKSLEALQNDPEYRALLRWFLKEGPWSEVQQVATPMLRNRDARSERQRSRQRGMRPQSRQPHAQHVDRQPSQRSSEESSSICVIS